MTEYQKREIAKALPTGTNTIGGVNISSPLSSVSNNLAVCLDGNSNAMGDAKSNTPQTGVPVSDWGTTLYFPVYPFAFNGTTWDRLRTMSSKDTTGKALQVGMCHKYLNITGSVQVLAAAGVLHTITVNAGTTTGTITIYDNPAATGTKIASINVIKDLNPFTLIFDCACANGIYVSYDGTVVADLTCTYV